jgi:DNA-binding response OmpR family regulator
MKVIIVEDQLLTAEHIQMVFSQAGHEVIAIATNVVEALIAIERNIPDLIVLDIELGKDKLGGIRILNELYGNIPALVLTGHSTNETFLLAKDNAAAFLSKPFREQDLIYQAELITRAHEKSIKPYEDDFFVFDRKNYIKISKKEVVYLIARKTRTLIYFQNKPDPTVVGMNLGYVYQYFTESNFFRLSHSLVINLQLLNEIKDNKLFFEKCERPLEITDEKRALLKKNLTILKNRN